MSQNVRICGGFCAAASIASVHNNMLYGHIHSKALKPSKRLQLVGFACLYEAILLF